MAECDTCANLVYDEEYEEYEDWDDAEDDDISK